MENFPLRLSTSCNLREGDVGERSSLHQVSRGSVDLGEYNLYPHLVNLLVSAQESGFWDPKQRRREERRCCALENLVFPC